MAAIIHLASPDLYFFENIGKMLDIKHYDEFMLVDDCNAEESEQCLSKFTIPLGIQCQKYVKENTSLKNWLNL